MIWPGCACLECFEAGEAIAVPREEFDRYLASLPRLDSKRENIATVAPKVITKRVKISREGQVDMFAPKDEPGD